jgi:hypothetical protein
VQLPGHSHREGTLPGQDVGSTLPRAEQTPKIGLGIAPRFHAVADRLNGLGRLDRPALALVVLDDQCEKIEAVRFLCARLRFVFEVPLDLFKGFVVFGFGTNWTNHFFRHDTVSGSMRSYSAWVPGAPANSGSWTLFERNADLHIMQTLVG